MTKYLKIPILVYENSSHDKYIKSLGLDLDEDPETDDIDKIVRQSARAKSYQGVAKPQGVMTYSRFPVTAFEGCSYEPSASLQTLDVPWGTDRFDCTMIYLKDSQVICASMSIYDFEDLMIRSGIVDPDINDQYPSEKL